MFLKSDFLKLYILQIYIFREFLRQWNGDPHHLTIGTFAQKLRNSVEGKKAVNSNPKLFNPFC